MGDPVEIRVGQVWRDLDPRGGPTFVVVEVDDWRATVTNLDGKRRRRILRTRFRVHGGYRTGYVLVSDQEAPDGD